MEVVVTTGAISHAKLQSNHHHQQTNIQFFYRRDALSVAQPTVSKHWWEKYHIPWTCLPQAHLGVFQLCLWPLNKGVSDVKLNLDVCVARVLPDISTRIVVLWLFCLGAERLSTSCCRNIHCTENGLSRCHSARWEIPEEFLVFIDSAHCTLRLLSPVHYDVWFFHPTTLSFT